MKEFSDPQGVAHYADGPPRLAPEEDEAILRDAGFSNISLFYVGFTFRGWVAYAGD